MANARRHGCASLEPTEACVELSLQSFTSNKQWLVLAFVPMAWTFVCPTEIIAFSERAGDFAARGADVVFASTDSEYSLLAWTNASRKDGGLGAVDIALLSDKNHRLSRDYGVLIEDLGVALRGLFLIDPEGIVRQMTVNDLSVGRSVDETLRLLDAFQFADKYGEVCPANWNRGSDTIKATPEGNKEYTRKLYGDTKMADTGNGGHGSLAHDGHAHYMDQAPCSAASWPRWRPRRRRRAAAGKVCSRSGAGVGAGAGVWCLTCMDRPGILRLNQATTVTALLRVTTAGLGADHCPVGDINSKTSYA